MTAYELRTYYASTGRLQDLIRRYELVTVPMLNDFGMELVGAWLSSDQSDALVYLVRHSGDPKDAWREFLADERWIAAVQATEADGKLARGFESRFLTPVEASPLR